MPETLQLELSKVHDLLLDVVCVVDADGRFVALSAACEQVFGYQPAELIGTPMLDLVHPDDRDRTLQAASGVMGGNPLRNFENRYVRKDGRVIDIMWTARWSEGDRLRLAVAREVTARKRDETMQAARYAIAQVAHEDDDLSALLGQIHRIVDGMLPADCFVVTLREPTSGAISIAYAAGDHVAVHTAACTALATEVMRTSTTLLLQPESRAQWPQAAQVGIAPGEDDWLAVPLLAGQRNVGALVTRKHASGLRYGEEQAGLLQFVSAHIAHAIERQQANSRLRYLAQYDLLTGLPNRVLFDDRLQVALSQAARERTALALLYIDLDDFKPVNDSFGHETGDQLLQEAARRILHCVRESDTVSRIGGDEFLVLLRAIHAPQNATTVAENIRDELVRPFALAGRSLRIKSSVGIAVYPEHGTDRQQLVRNADSAMYAAKNRGGNCCLLFSAPV